jgi:ribonuclease G
MSKNSLVISVDIKETRVALIEDGIIAELHIERRGHPSSGTVGNVALGRVTRVLPGLQAAFIDVGQERAAFLHVEDLIRPDDFESYLAGGRKHAHEERPPAEDEVDDLEATAPVAAMIAKIEEAAHTAQHVEPDAPSISDLQAEAEAQIEAGVHDSDDEHGGGEAEALDATDAREDDDDDAIDVDRASASEGAVPAGRSSDVTLDTSSPELPSGPDLPSRPSLPSEPAAASEPPHANGAVADAGEELAPPPMKASRPPRGSGRPSAAAAKQARIEAAAAAAEALLAPAPPPAAPSAPAAPAAPAGRASGPALLDDDLGDDLPGFTISEPGEPVPRAPAAPRAPAGDRGGRRRGRGRGGARGRETGGREAAPAPAGRADDRGGSREGGGGGGRGRSGPGRDGREGGRSHGGRGGERGGGSVPNRISKSTPIREVVREGQEIIVQISKDPIGTKGARCTSHISLPGRYVVYLPTVDHIGVSKRIGSEKERARLREAIESMKPPSGGLIVRTVAEGLTKKQLKADVGYLVRLWGEIAKKREGAKAPALLSSELDLVLKTARDLFTDDVEQIVVDDKQQYERLCRFVEMFAPERVKDIVYYSGQEPIFDAYGIEDEIQRALSRKVPLPSGGHLIIDQAEALTAIDVNTGRFVGKGSKDMEETILKTNLEAVHEIAYQLRFRNIGGLIILDLIDMDKHKNRETVRRTLEEVLQKDKAKTTLNRISDLGLIEMTRKRTRESLGRLGTGQLQSKETIAYEILREIRRKRADLPGYSVVVNAHPAVADLLTGPEKLAVAEAENRYMRKIHVVPRKDYHLEQFDLTGK